MKESLLGFMPFVLGHMAPDRNRRGERQEEDRAGWVAWHWRGKDGADERTPAADLRAATPPGSVWGARCASRPQRRG
jgi:hypothetical protein